ncbi:MAG: MFS transporter [Clostridia bacterium]|nr:MFS transporter [Clostridia bacterium]
MVKTLIRKTKSMERDFLLFLLVGVFLGIGQSVDNSTLTNFLKDKFQIDVIQRTALEIPRELPGFLVYLIIGFLYAFGDIRIAAFANICAAAGMLLLGIIPSEYSLVLICIFVYSTGQHVYMPLSNSIGMNFAKEGNLGRKLGQLSSFNTASLVISSAALWLLIKIFDIGYTVSFSIGALSFTAAAFLLLLMKKEQKEKSKTRFVFRKEYKLFYWLCILFGARKQIFLTFGTWVLVDVFEQQRATMTILFFIIASLGIFIKPLIGHMVDKIGERIVLAGESAILFFVCLGYAFSNDLLKGSAAIFLVSACYVLDQCSSSVSMARSTYLKKIAVSPEDVSPTLSLGISIDHIVSMFLPVLGGVVWQSGGADGYKYVFIGGAVIALINFFSARRIKI